MSISVMVPTLLRSFTRDQKRVEVQGNTVLEVIEQMEREYPGVALKNSSHGWGVDGPAS